jgi:hypothetical protein
MNVLLSIFGFLSALILAGILGVVWLYWTRIKRSYLYGLAASINRFPNRIRLLPQTTFNWKKPGRAEQRVAEFRATGFADLGGYLVEELSNARVFALQHPGSGLIGMVFESDELGTWSDALLFMPDLCQPILASSLLKQGQLRLLPGDPKIHKPEATVVQLCEAITAAAPPVPAPEPVTRDNFPARYEEAFAGATDARLMQSLEDHELRRLVMERGQPCCGEITEKEFLKIKRLLPLAVENELRLACGVQFLRDTKMAASEWQQATQRLLIIHDRTGLPRLSGRLIYGVFLTKRLRQRLKKARHRRPPRPAFAELNDMLPAWERYKKLGEVTRPVAADIYCAPVDRTIT